MASETFSGRSKSGLRRPSIQVATAATGSFFDGARNPAAPVPPENSGGDPAYLMRILGFRWKAILSVGLVLTVAAVTAVCLYWPPQWGQTYSTVALIRVEAAEAVPGAAAPRADFRDLRTQCEVVKTRFVVESALKNGPAAELPIVQEDTEAVIKRLVADLKVDVVSPQILRIGLTGPDRENLPVLVNAVKDAYMREIVQAESTRRVKRKEFLEAAYRDCEKRLQDRRKELAEAEVLKGSPEEADDKLAFERYASLQRELVRIEMGIQRSRVESALHAKEEPATKISEAALADLVERDSIVRQHRERAHLCADRIAHWERTAIDPTSHDSYKGLLREKKAAEQAITARAAEIAQSHIVKVTEDHATRAARTKANEARLEDEERQIRGMVERGWEDLKKRSRGAPELKLKRYEVERLEGIAKQVMDELEGLRLESEVIGRSATLQEAPEPTTKAGSKQSLRIGAAALMPMLLVAGCVAGWELRVRRIFSPNEVRRGLGVRVLAALPVLSKSARQAADPAMGSGGRPTVQSEAVDRLRAILQHGFGNESPRIVMVTSASPGEGKSTLARQLAASLARAGQRTVLVDADLFRPTADDAFELRLGAGLADVLAGTSTLGAALRPTATANLLVLPAGTVTPDAFAAVSKGGFEAVARELRETHDCIVIDSSPVLATTLPLLVGRSADAVVLSVLAGVSRGPEVTDTLQRLADLNIPVAGAVVNGSEDAGRYGYYYRPRDVRIVNVA